MNIVVKTVGGGVFSKFMVAIQSILHEVADVDTITNIYIEVDMGRLDKRTQPNLILNESGNPFDFVLDQHLVTPDKVILATPRVTYTDHENLMNNAEELRRLRVICGKINIKKTVLDRVVDGVDNKTLGVHIRLTDMSQYHPELHGGSTTKDYITKIGKIITNQDIKKIFVASDNELSLKEIRDIYGDMVLSNMVTNRTTSEDTPGYCTYQIQQMHTESFWVDTFIDMITLSKCGELVYKVSNLNNASMCFSSTLGKTYKL